jgi:queuine/archaeosine tRNA-ribosyltransferase
MTKKYSYVPAALDSSTRGFTLGVRYRKPDADNKYKVTKVKNAIRIDLIDRQVYFLRSSKDPSHRLMALDMDEVLDLTFSANPSLLTKAGFDFAMVNSHSLPQKYYRDYAHEETKDWPEIVADSGGFQLSTGTSDFLDPKAIVEAQNQICSIGISLDIPFPITHVSEVPLLRRAAHTQRLNNEVFKKHKRPGLKLMNVFHGPNFYLFDKYREVVEDSSIDRVALGGVRRLDLTSLALRILNATLKGPKYKQYHVLGVSGLERWVLLCYMAHKNIAKLLTSDSSTYLQCGATLQAFDPGRLCYSKSLQMIRPEVEQHQRLFCSCPVCSVLGYTSTMNDRSNPMGFQAAVFHNLFVGKNYIDEIYELTKLPLGEILKYLSKYSSHGKVQTMRNAMQAVDMALQDGLEKAAKKYSPFLLQKEPYSPVRHAGLFKGVNVASKKSLDMRERIGKLLDKFDRYHGTNSK